jgi:type I restriction enzyme, S subunit
MALIESNEPWLGSVPAEWKRTRIRNVARLSPGFSGTPPTADEFCTVVPMELLFENGTLDVSNQQRSDDVQQGLTLFENGDVLFAKITPCMENGKRAFVENLPTRYAFGSTEFHILRPSWEVDGKFLYYATFKPVFRVYAAENMTGAAGQKRVSSRFLKDTRLFLPSLPEQKIITAFLDSSCAVIDGVASLEKRSDFASRASRGVLNQQMETLAAYRKSLIHECVTGQRRVPGTHANPIAPATAKMKTDSNGEHHHA